MRRMLRRFKRQASITLWDALWAELYPRGWSGHDVERLALNVNARMSRGA